MMGFQGPMQTEQGWPVLATSSIPGGVKRKKSYPGHHGTLRRKSLQTDRIVQTSGNRITKIVLSARKDHERKRWDMIIACLRYCWP